MSAEVSVPAQAPGTSTFSGTLTNLQQQVEILVKQGSRINLQTALSRIDEGLNYDPWFFPLWKLKAVIHFRLNEYADAQQAIDVYRGRYPHDIEILMTQLDVLLQRKPDDATDTRESLEFFLARIDKQDFFNVLSAFLIRPATSAKDVELFLDAWKNISASIDEEQVRELIALCAKSDPAAAVPIFTSLVENKKLPGSPLGETLYFLLGRDLGKTTLDTLGIEYLTKAADLGFSLVETAYEIGNIHFLHERYHNAAESWEPQWRRASNPEQWVLLIADARINAKEYENAEKILDAGRRSFPRNPALQGKYMLALRALEREYELDMYERQLDGMNAFVGLSYGRALVAEFEGNMTLAREEINKAIEYGQAASNVALQGRELERWMQEVAEATASSEATREALELRDLGWNYWQEREYRQAYAVWEEALDIGFPQVRQFILNITMRLIEVGMMREAATILREHLPQLTFFGFAQMLVSAERWYLVPGMMSAISRPSAIEAPWVALYDLYGCIRMGLKERIPAAMERFVQVGAPVSSYAFTSIDDLGELFSRSLSATHYQRLILRLAGDILTQRDLQLLISYMNTPQWNNLPPKNRSEIVAKASHVAVTQYNLDFILSTVRSPVWEWLPESDREMLIEALVRMAVEQQRTDIYPNLFESPEWKLLHIATQTDLLAEAGWALYQQGEQAQGVEYLKQALALDPDHGNANMVMALYERSMNRIEESKAYLEKGMLRARPDLKAYVLAGLALLEDDREAAAAHYAEYLRIVPDDHWVRLYIIETLASIHRYEEAKAQMGFFEKLYADGDNDVRRFLALAKLILGEPETAAELFGALSFENPDDTNALRSWADALAACGEHEKVIEILTRKCLETGDPRMAMQIAESNIALGKPIDALDWAETGLENDPANRNLTRIAANAAQSMGQLELAEAYSARLVNMDSHNISANTLVIEILREQEKWNAVHSHDIKVLATNSIQQRMLMAESDGAKTKIDRRSLKKAEKFDHQLLKHYDNEPDNIIRASISSAGVSNFRLAVPKLEDLVELGPNQSVAALMFPSVSDIVSVEGLPLEEFEEYLKMVKSGNSRFASIEDLRTVPDKGREWEAPEQIPVLIVVGRSSKATLLKIDALLENYDARACLVIGEESLMPETPTYADPPLLKRFAASGRWEFLLSDYGGRTIPRDEAGTMVSFWAQPMWVGDHIETEDEMFMRWKSAMSRLLAMVKYNGIKTAGWVYPGGDYGQLSIDTDDTVRSAYRRAVKDQFTFAFAPTSRGSSVPHEDAWRIPMRNIYNGTPLDIVSNDLKFRHPTREGVLELAKIMSWHGQLPRADRLFHRAEELGLTSEDLYYFHGRNAYYEEDVPTTLELARKAREIAPDSLRVKQLMEDAEERLRPLAGIITSTENDSDERHYDDIRLVYSDYVTERLMLFGDAGYGKWRDESGSMDGAFFNLGARYHTKPEHWIEGSIGYSFFDEGGGGGYPALRFGYHGAYSLNTKHINGTYDLMYSHGGIGTRQAIAEGIREDTLQASTYFRFDNWWDIILSAYFTTRSDGNNTWWLNFRPMYRVLEYPQLSVGYWGQIADSDENPDAYWAPVDYQSHLFVLTLRHAFSPRLSAGLLAGYGMSTSDGSDWGEVWRNNEDITWRFLEDWMLRLMHNHTETPTYRMDRFQLGVYYRF